MAALSIVAANVAEGEGIIKDTKTCGAAVVAGNPVYLDAADSKMKLADCSVAATCATTKGIALHTSANNQPLTFAIGGKMNLGATLVVGVTYYVGDVAGEIIPETDLSTGEFPFRLGFAETAAVFVMDLRYLGVARG